MQGINAKKNNKLPKNSFDLLQQESGQSVSLIPCI